MQDTYYYNLDQAVKATLSTALLSGAGKLFTQIATRDVFFETGRVGAFGFGIAAKIVSNSATNVCNRLFNTSDLTNKLIGSLSGNAVVFTALKMGGAVGLFTPISFSAAVTLTFISTIYTLSLAIINKPYITPLANGLLSAGTVVLLDKIKDIDIFDIFHGEHLVKAICFAAVAKLTAICLTPLFAKFNINDEAINGLSNALGGALAFGAYYGLATTGRIATPFSIPAALTITTISVAVSILFHPDWKSPPLQRRNNPPPPVYNPPPPYRNPPPYQPPQKPPFASSPAALSEEAELERQLQGFKSLRDFKGFEDEPQEKLGRDLHQFYTEVTSILYEFFPGGYQPIDPSEQRFIEQLSFRLVQLQSIYPALCVRYQIPARWLPELGSLEIQPRAMGASSTSSSKAPAHVAPQLQASVSSVKLRMFNVTTQIPKEIDTKLLLKCDEYLAEGNEDESLNLNSSELDRVRGWLLIRNLPDFLKIPLELIVYGHDLNFHPNRNCIIGYAPLVDCVVTNPEQGANNYYERAALDGVIADYRAKKDAYDIERVQKPDAKLEEPKLREPTTRKLLNPKRPYLEAPPNIKAFLQKCIAYRNSLPKSTT